VKRSTIVAKGADVLLQFMSNTPPNIRNLIADVVLEEYLRAGMSPPPILAEVPNTVVTGIDPVSKTIWAGEEGSRFEMVNKWEPESAVVVATKP